MRKSLLFRFFTTSCGWTCGRVPEFWLPGGFLESTPLPCVAMGFSWILVPSKGHPPKKTLVEPDSGRKQIFQVAFHGATAMCEGNVKIPYAWFPDGFPYAYRQEFTMLRSSHQKIDLKLLKRAFASLRYRPQDAVQKKSRRESNALIARPSRLNLVGNN